MNIYKQNTKKGFIALFYTLSISMILLTYVSVSSASVFDFMRVREGFNLNRESRTKTIKCADDFIDMFIRSHYEVFIESNQYCNISNIKVVQINRDIMNLSFKSDDIYVKGVIKNGFIYDLLFYNFPL